MTEVSRAWIWLLSLSAASTILASAVARGTITVIAPSLVGALILTLAWAKARLILNAYLGLNRAPFFRRGFGISLALYACLLLTLYLAGS